jgi:S1-C subfamily serine protease
MRTRSILCFGGLVALAAVTLTSLLRSQPPAADGLKVDPRVLAAEQKRIAVIEKVRPAVAAVGGGSGVLISDDGLCLTNYHVVAGPGPAGGVPVIKAGLSNGIQYDAVLVGMDKVGDISLIKLLPKKEGEKFPFAALGDSDKLKAGDWSLAMGNPFGLAKDFTPTVTFGLVSGVHRYQYPEGGVQLDYTDCIQFDTSINPGNSGGPLFNMDGEVVGINGRGSFDKRHRINSGVGYAISSNQIKNFLGQLKVGLDTDHASLGAVAASDVDEGVSVRMVVQSILEDSDAYRRGLADGDEVVAFAGRPLSSINQFKNVLGLFPKGWRMPLVYRHENDKKEVEKREVLVRLMGYQRKVIVIDPGDEDKKPKPPQPKIAIPAAVAKVYEAKPGFANYYFNKQERDRLLAGFHKHGDFTNLGKNWTAETEDEVKGKKSQGQFSITEEKDDKNSKPLVKLTVNGIDYDLEPLKTGLPAEVLKDPRNSGGLLEALYQYHELMTVGEKAFPTNFSHGGIEPFYPPLPPGNKPDFAKQRVDCEVLRTESAGVSAKWYFSQKDQTLLGFEVWVEDVNKDDPCEVYLSEYAKVEGDRMLPHKFEVVYGNNRYATLNVKEYKFAAAK